MGGRVGRTRSPRTVGRQSWRDLVFLHWDFEPEAIRPLVPPPFDLHLHDGRAWVGIIPFRVEGLRPLGFPVGLSFLETNVRTYVTLNGEPAIWFLSLDAESTAAVLGARVLYGLPYRRARMSRSRAGQVLEYAHERLGSRGGAFRVRCRIGDELGTAAPGSLESYLVERYRFQVVRAGWVWTTEVRHPPYGLRAAHVEEVDPGILSLDGVPAPSGGPVACYSPGVDVELLATRRAT